MDITTILIWLLLGAVAGWIAGQLMKGGGFGLIGNIIVGIIGAFVGGWLQGILQLPLGSGMIGSIITAVLGAVLVLFVVSLIKKAK